MAHRARVWLYPAYALVAAVVTWAVIRKSMQDGRLSAAPDWDDVLYFTYAAKRLNELHASGLVTSLGGFFQTPPHSPYSCLMAYGAFLLAGYREWAPYAASGVTLFLFVLVCDRLMRGARPVVRLLAVGYVLTVPVVTLMVAQFKPDIPWGMAVATAGMLTFARPVLGAPVWRHVLIGVAWAAAFLAKPTTSPGTAMLVAGSLGLAVAQHWVLTRQRPEAGDVARAVAGVTATVAVLIAPHYGAHWDYIEYYIGHTLFGEYRDVWVLRGGAWVHALYYLTGQAGRINAGWHLVIFAGVWAAGFVVAVRRRDREVFWPGVSLLLFTTACYLMPTVNPVKNALLGAPFYCAGILATVYSAAYLNRQLGTKVAAVGLLVLLSVGASVYRWPGRHYAEEAPERAQSRRLHHEVLDALRPHLKEYPQLVTVTATGPVREITLDWFATIERMPMEFKRPGSDKLPDYQLAFDESDFALAQENGVLGSLHVMVNERVQGKVLAAIRAREDYRQIGAFTAEDGKRLYLFERVDRRRGVLSGVRALEGLSPLNHPKGVVGAPFMAASGRPTRLLVLGELAGPSVLRLTGVPGPDVRAVRVQTAEGRELFEHVFTEAGKVETVIVPLPGGFVGELVLAYDYHGKSVRRRDRTVSFTRIERVSE